MAWRYGSLLFLVIGASMIMNLAVAQELRSTDIIKRAVQAKPDIAAGKRLFSEQCANCHGTQAHGMPGWLYRWYFRAHSVRSLQRNILHFIGFRRVRATLIGGVANLSQRQRQSCLQRMRWLGERAL